MEEKNAGQNSIDDRGCQTCRKVYVAETFGKNEYDSYILIDFSIASQTVKDLLMIFPI